MTHNEWLISTDPAVMLRWLEELRGIRPAIDDGSPSYVVTDRKLRLFACACAEPAEDHYTLDERLAVRADWRRWADSPGPREMDALEGARYWCGVMVGRHHLRALSSADRAGRANILRDIVGDPFEPVKLLFDRLGSRPCPDCPEGQPDEYCDDCGGDGEVTVWGYPWLTEQVLSLARAAYECRERECDCDRPAPWRGNVGYMAFCQRCRGTGRIDDGTLDPARLSVLADALLDAGCPEEWCGDCGNTGWSSSPTGDTAAYGGDVQISPCNCPRRAPHPLLAHLRSDKSHVRGCWAVDLILGKE